MQITDWLLDSDPSIRWQVKRDLLNEPPSSVQAERELVAREGWGAKLLALQDERGYWGGDEYGEDRKSVFWTLALLRRLGAEPHDPSVREAVAKVHDGVTWHYWDNLPYFHGEVEPCINGGVLGQGAYFDRLGDGSDRLLLRLLDEQLPDGGWNCEAPESKVSSFDTTLCVVEGLLEYERYCLDSRADDAGEARRRGEEYLLQRSLFRRLSDGEVPHRRYLNFSFPPYWFYDVLRTLDHFRDAGGPFDPRMQPALDEVVTRRGQDGRWNAGIPWPGDVYFDVDAPEGEPSRWNTLRALRVLRWAEESGSSS